MCNNLLSLSSDVVIIEVKGEPTHQPAAAGEGWLAVLMLLKRPGVGASGLSV